MEIEELVTDLKKLSEEVEIEKSKVNRLYFWVDSPNVPKVGRFLFAQKGGRLATVSGVDTPQGIELLYHFAFDKHHLVATMKTKVPRERPVISTLTKVTKAANWIEREIHEMLGVRFEDHPNLRRLLKAESWKDEEYPLRRDFPYKGGSS